MPFIVAILASCTTAHRSPAPIPAASGGAMGGVPRGGLLTVTGDGGIWLVRSRATAVERWPAGKAEQEFTVALPLVPAEL
ncbi:MAG TPA: hypothetical protein VGF40_18090, partial [Thermoanaerobaculia bacterium]